MDSNDDWQVNYISPRVPNTKLDVDQDGFIDTIDSDNNSIPGVGDGGSALVDEDTDGDTFPNRLDLDSDNYGIHDVVESGGTDTDGNGMDRSRISGEGFCKTRLTNERITRKSFPDKKHQENRRSGVIVMD